MSDEQNSPGLEDIFHRAVELPSSEERTAYLDQACGDDAVLRSRVEALLRHDADAGSFLEKPPEELADGPVDVGATGSGVSNDDAWQELLEPADSPECLGRLGTCEVTELIGRGGMGLVLRAHDPKLHRVVAIKLLAPELAAQPVSVQRFLREARAAAAVSHDHVVSIYAIDDEAKPPRIVMEMIDGQSLQQKIDSTGALDVKSILRIGMQTASGLSAAHRQGLVHRDIKPANILLENGIEKVKLTDFGLARAVDDIGMTKTGQITGTPQYMSPEQAQGQRVDHRTDLFSLGCVLYAMCTGRAAFRADSAVAVLHRIVHDTPRPIREVNEDIPDWLCAIVEKLLAKEPEARFESAADVEELLGRHLAHIQQPETIPKPELVSSPVRGDEPGDAHPQPSTRWLWGLLFGLVPICSAALIRSFGGVGTAEASIISLLFTMMLGGAGALVLLVLRQRTDPANRMNPRRAKAGTSPDDSKGSQKLESQLAISRRPIRCQVALLLIGVVWIVAIGDGLQLIRGITAETVGLSIYLLTSLYFIAWGSLAVFSTLIRQGALSATARSQMLRRGLFFAGLLISTGVFVSHWCGVDDSDGVVDKWKDFTHHGAIRFKLASDRTRVEFNGDVLNDDDWPGHRSHVLALWLSEPGEYEVRTILNSGIIGESVISSHQGSHALIHGDKDATRIVVTGPTGSPLRPKGDSSIFYFLISVIVLIVGVVAFTIAQQRAHEDTERWPLQRLALPVLFLLIVQAWIVKLEMEPMNGEWLDDMRVPVSVFLSVFGGAILLLASYRSQRPVAATLIVLFATEASLYTQWRGAAIAQVVSGEHRLTVHRSSRDVMLIVTQNDRVLAKIDENYGRRHALDFPAGAYEITVVTPQESSSIWRVEQTDFLNPFWFDRATGDIVLNAGQQHHFPGGDGYETHFRVAAVGTMSVQPDQEQDAAGALSDDVDTDTESSPSSPDDTELTEKHLRELLPEAAGVPRAELAKLAAGVGAPDLSVVTGTPLSLMLLMADPSRVPDADRERAVDEFRYLTGPIIKPSELVKAISLHPEKEFATFLQPEYIQAITVNVVPNATDGTGAANGEVSFLAPEVFAGRVSFDAARHDGQWQIQKFSLAAYQITVQRDDEGIWRRVDRAVPDSGTPE